MYLRSGISLVLLLITTGINAQVSWTNVDSLYQPLPPSVHVYFTDQRADTSPFRAYYLVADLKNKKLDFTADTSHNRRLTPSEFYEKNGKPLVVVNCTFFSFESNRSLNALVKNGKLLAYNRMDIPGKGKDTLTYRHVLLSAIGISKKRKADIAWVYTDSLHGKIFAAQTPMPPLKDSFPDPGFSYIDNQTSVIAGHSGKLFSSFKACKMKTAVGGGPVLVQNGEIKIANNEELKFAGKAIHDKHPRTAMGYTADGKLIILVVEGRSESASGATLTLEAEILKNLGCTEALNLDGGGSSCMLINGKETIKVSDAKGQRPVPAVFIIRQR